MARTLAFSGQDSCWHLCRGRDFGRCRRVRSSHLRSQATGVPGSCQSGDVQRRNNDRRPQPSQGAQRNAVVASVVRSGSEYRMRRHPRDFARHHKAVKDYDTAYNSHPGSGRWVLRSGLDAPMMAESELAQWIARWRSGASALVLLGSVSLNVALASYIAIQALSASTRPLVRIMPEEPADAPDNQIAKFAARLPSRDADILWEVYRTKKPQILDAEAAPETARHRALSLPPHHHPHTTPLPPPSQDTVARPMHN